jgi:hypothetical protein
MDQGDLPLEERAAEFGKLFEGYLTVKDRVSAAGVLLDVAELWRRQDWASAFEAANKCIELFRDTTDPKVATSVDKAFAFRFEVTAEDDPDLIPECIEYGNWLACAPLDSSEATSTLGEIRQYIPGKVWIEIATRFICRFRRSRPSITG